MEKRCTVFYYSKKKVLTGIAESGHCWRQRNYTMGDHDHIFWNCAAIQPNWLDIMSEIKSILGFEINFNFGTVYLVNIPTELNNQDKYFLKILLVDGKKAINKKWLNKEPQSKREWSAIVKEIYEMKKRTFSLKKLNLRSTG